MGTEQLLLAEWKEEIAQGVGDRKLDRVWGGVVTLHSTTLAEDTDAPGGAQEMINARAEHARKLAVENPDVPVAALAERTGVSTYTISRARRTAGA
jgi:hypothetical protein